MIDLGFLGRLLNFGENTAISKAKQIRRLILVSTLISSPLDSRILFAFVVAWHLHETNYPITNRWTKTPCSNINTQFSLIAELK